MENEKKQVPGTTPGEEKKETEESKQAATPGIPQGRFDEVYGKWKTAEEERETLRQERDYYKSLQIPKEEPKAEPRGGFDWDTFQENPEAIIDRRVEEKLRQIKTVESQQVSRDKVREKHPDLFNTDGSPNVTSSKFKIYDRIVSQNPEYFHLRKGPEFAMRDMEEELAVEEQKRIKADEAEKLKQAKEEGKKEEQKRSAEAKGSFTTSATAPKEEVKAVELTVAEKAIAHKMNMTYEEYAKAKAKKASNIIMR